jgi:hypothetical protein
MALMKLSAKMDRTDGGTPWGFRMAGGKDFGSPLIVQRVNPGSLAAKCGLQEGDVIVRIGRTPADQLRHKDAQNAILDAGNALELALERGPGAGGGGGTVHHVSSPADNYSSPYSSQPQPSFGAPRPFNDAISSPMSSMTIGSQPAEPSVPWARAPPSGGGYQPSAPRPAGPWQPQVPTGPRKMRVGKPGEAKSLPGAGGGMRIPMCSACGIAIRGPFVSALDKTWCPDHFVCANPHCRTPLINVGFVEEEGQLFCEKDYEQYFAPRCGKCGRAIIGEVVNAMKNTFHMNCFVCCQCHQPIGTGSFHNEDGKIYCPKDWAAMFQTKCHGCQFPIEPGDRWVEALNQNYHSECFNCSTCQVSLEGQSFFAKNGKPYCRKHASGGRY